MIKSDNKVLMATAAGLVCLLLAGQAAAHGIYAKERHDEVVIIYGHGPTDEKYEHKDLLELKGYGKDSAALKVDYSSKNGYITLAPSEDLKAISGVFDNGYWSEQADGEWVKKSKDQIEGAKQGGRYMKYNTTILKPLGGAPKATGALLEIVPMVDPLTLKQGDKLEVQVLSNGEPVPNIELAAEITTNRMQNVVKTDRNGKATITIRNDGLNVLGTETETKLEDTTKADKSVNFATLAFTYPLGADE